MLDLFEAVLFRLRLPILIAFVALTALCGWLAAPLKLETDLVRQLPVDQPFIQTALDYRDKIAGLNSVQIVVENKHGSVWDPAFLKKLYDVTQDVFYLRGVSRTSVTSMWTPNTQVYEATEGAVEGHNLIPNSVSPDAITKEQVAQIRDAAFKGGLRGRLFSLDSKAAMIQASIDASSQDTGFSDLFDVARDLEKIRAKYENADTTVRIIGFTKFVGDIGDEARDVVMFFVIALIASGLALWYYSRSLALTAITIFCSAASIVWLLAAIVVLHLSLNPLGLIVPFLVYAIGVSHGVQQINRFLVAIVRGHTSLESAQRTFRRLLIPGFFSLVTVAAAFAAMMIVPIPLIRDLALIATIGIAFKLVSNLVMLPLMASYVHFSPAHVARQKALFEARQNFMGAISQDAHPVGAAIVTIITVAIAAFGIYQARTVAVGPSKPGAPELWSSARYNVDSTAIANSFDLDLDSFVIVSNTPPDACVNYPVMALIERFGTYMRTLPGVKSVFSMPEATRYVYSLVQEGNLKWRVLSRSPEVLAIGTTAISDTTGLRNSDCTILPIAVYLTDHKDETLRRVATAAEKFIAANKMEDVEFRLATGNGGVLAGINDSIRKSTPLALGVVFAVIAILVFAAYRDWRAAICCVIPIAIVTTLGLALMSILDIGLTVTTLPVIILSVGIGVDYGLYLYERIETHLAEGLTMDNAFIMAMREEGAAVVYTALTLALGVLMWAFSGLKFQADMGWLLSFLVLANALFAITVMPSLAVVLDMLVPRRRQASAGTAA
ncbi:MAG: MMPL family transporter [Alphaproteobacteria bacterium]|nr:MMPL family transporter [Alphaproteobacteria bacterium]